MAANCCFFDCHLQSCLHGTVAVAPCLYQFWEYFFLSGLYAHQRIVAVICSLSCCVLHVVDTVAGAVRKLCKETNSVVVSVE